MLARASIAGLAGLLYAASASPASAQGLEEFAPLNRPIFDASYGVGFRDSILAIDGNLHQRPILEEFARFRLRGPVGSWKLLTLGVAGEFRNEDLLDQENPSGATGVGVRGRLDLIPLSIIPVRAWGGMNYLGTRGDAYAFGHSANIDGGAEVELRLPEPAPQFRVLASVQEAKRGPELDEPAVDLVLADFDLDVVENAGPLRAVAGYQQQSWNDRLAGRQNTYDSWSARGSLRAHRTVRLALGGAVNRYRSWDRDGWLADMQAANADARLTWHPQPEFWGGAFYRYRRDQVVGYHRTAHTTGLDSALQLHPGIWLGGVFGLDSVTEGLSEGAADSLSEQQLIRLEAFKSTGAGRGRLSSHAGFGYVQPQDGDGGLRGLARVRAEGALYPARVLALHGDASYERVDDRSADDLDVDRVAAGGGIAVRGMRGLVADGRYRLAWLAPTARQGAVVGHDLDVRLSALPLAWLRLAARIEAEWLTVGAVTTRQGLASGTASIRLGSGLWADGALRYGSYQLSDAATRDQVEGVVGLSLKIRRLLLTAFVQSRYDLDSRTLSRHSISIQASHQFASPR